MTTYIRDGETITINRAAAERARDSAARDARSAADRGATRQEAEMGWTDADVWQWSKARAREAARLTKVLACIDAGMAELPRELYPA